MIDNIMILFLGGQALLSAAPVVSAGALPAGTTGLPSASPVAGTAWSTATATASAELSQQAGAAPPSEHVVDPISSSPPPPASVPPSCTFFLVRHGQSKPNVEGKIVSGMEGGVDPANGLTEEGLEQARRRGRELKEVFLKAGCPPSNTMVVTSPFSRARETAEAIQECLDCELREEGDLRERWFGDLDGRDDVSSYNKVWALDAVSSRHGELGVEPAHEVAARAASVVHRIRKEVSVRQRFHTGEGQPFPAGPSAVVLVSHGDALQLLQCVLSGRPLEQHRSLPSLENCGVRALRPPPDEDRGAREGAEGGGGGRGGAERGGFIERGV